MGSSAKLHRSTHKETEKLRKLKKNIQKISAHTDTQEEASKEKSSSSSSSNATKQIDTAQQTTKQNNKKQQKEEIKTNNTTENRMEMKQNRQKDTDAIAEIARQQNQQDTTSIPPRDSQSTNTTNEEEVVESQQEGEIAETYSKTEDDNIQQNQAQSHSQILTVLLANASLVPFLQRGTHTLLTAENLTAAIAKTLPAKEREKECYRPDICHQTLLTLCDSPLNKAGKVMEMLHNDFWAPFVPELNSEQVRILIETSKGVCIEVHPATRIPRTYTRFAGLIVQLLHKFSIRATTGSEKLLKVIPGPITEHFPPNAYKICLSGDGPLVRINEYVETLPVDTPIVIAIGAMSHGDDTFADSWADAKISLSRYSLSASVACARLCGAFENLWDIV